MSKMYTFAIVTENSDGLGDVRGGCDDEREDDVLEHEYPCSPIPCKTAAPRLVPQTIEVCISVFRGRH